MCSIVRYMSLQKLVQVSVLHVLYDHTQGLVLRTHAQHAHDVSVTQLAQNLYLFFKISPAK